MDFIPKNYGEGKSYLHENRSRRTRRARPPLQSAHARAARVLGRSATEPQAAAFAPDQLRAPRGSGGPSRVLPSGAGGLNARRTTRRINQSTAFSSTSSAPKNTAKERGRGDFVLVGGERLPLRSEHARGLHHRNKVGYGDSRSTLGGCQAVHHHTIQLSPASSRAPCKA